MMHRLLQASTTKKYYCFLFGILCLGLILRIFAAWSWAETPYWHIPVADEGIYYDWAANWIADDYAPSTAYEFSPLPMYFYALLFRVFGVSPMVIRVANMVLGLLTCGLIAAITRQVSGARSALMATTLAATFQPFVFYNVTLMKTSLSVFMFAAYVLCLLRVLAGGKIRWTFLLGCAAALCLHIRGNYLVLLPLSMLACLGWRNTFSIYRAGVFALGALLILTPFVARNAIVTNRFVLSTTQGGFNFYLGNHHLYEAPFSRPTQFAIPSPAQQGTQFTIEASRRAGCVMTPADASTFWYRETFREMITQPTVTLKKSLLKLLAVGNRFDACDHFNLEYLRRFVPFLKIPLPVFAILFPLGLAGLLLLIKQRNVRWLLYIGAAYATTLVMFFTNGRYRLPLMIILIPGAATGLIKWPNWISRRAYKQLAFYSSLLCLLLVYSHLHLPGIDNGSTYNNIHGVILDISGKKEDAAVFWKKSIAEGDDSFPSACIELAKAACRSGDLQTAEEYLTMIPNESYALANKLALIAQIRVIQHRFPEAVDLLQQSLAVNAGEIPTRELLIGTLSIINPDKASKELQTQQDVRTFYKGL